MYTGMRVGEIGALGYTNVDDFVFVRKDETRYTGHTIGCATARRAEDAEKKRALEEMFSKVFIFSEYVSENKKIGNA